MERIGFFNKAIRVGGFSSTNDICNPLVTPFAK